MSDQSRVKPADPLDLAPHSTEAEEAVLGALLMDIWGDGVFTQVDSRLKPDDFFNVRCGWVYEAIQRVHQRGMPADMRTVAEELRAVGRLDDVGAESYLNYLPTIVPTALNARYYAEIVAEHSDRRRLLGAAGDVARMAHNTTLDITEIKGRSMDAVIQATNRRTTVHFQAAGDVTDQLADNLSKGLQPGIKTGFRDIDRHFRNGLTRGQYWILAARPAMGKSALALRIARNAASGKTSPTGKPARVLYFTFEMTAEDNQVRLISETMRLAINDVYDLTESSDYWPLFEKARATQEALTLWYEEEADTLEGMNAAVQQFVGRYGGVDLIVIDRVELVVVDGAQAGEENKLLTRVSSALLRMARRYAPVVAIAQLNRAVEQRSNKRPVLSDLRMSGSLEQDATVVMMLYRENYYNDEADPNESEVLIRKNRQGSVGTVKLFFKPELTAFYDVEWRHEHE
jgi:replicative DNA helicase